MGKRGDQLDGRSDLYSLGIVMYQMLTGDLPFKADTTMAMILAHLQARPTPIRTGRPDLQVSDAVAAVVMRLLEKQPEMRPASASALIAEIERAETEVVSPRETLRSLPENPYSPHAAAGALHSALRGASGREVGQVRAPATPLRDASARQPRPVPAAAPASRPAPAVRPPATALPPPKSSQWGMWVAVAVLAVGLAGGGWYISSRPSAPEPHSPTTTPTSTAPTPAADAPAGSATATPTEPPVKQPETAPPATGNRPTAGLATETPTPVRATKPAPAAVAPRTHNVLAVRQPEQQKPAIDPKQITSAIKMGDFYFGRGEYESALGEYQRGLGLDPTNQLLRAKIDRTRRAKAAEEKLNQ